MYQFDYAAYQSRSFVSFDILHAISYINNATCRYYETAEFSDDNINSKIKLLKFTSNSNLKL